MSEGETIEKHEALMREATQRGIDPFSSQSRKSRRPLPRRRKEMADRTTEEGRCETCLYVGGLANTPLQLLRCHRYAPRSESGYQTTTAGGFSTEIGALWPLVQPDDWCGEYSSQRAEIPDGYEGDDIENIRSILDHTGLYVLRIAEALERAHPTPL